MVRNTIRLNSTKQMKVSTFPQQAWDTFEPARHKDAMLKASAA